MMLELPVEVLMMPGCAGKKKRKKKEEEKKKAPPRRRSLDRLHRR